MTELSGRVFAVTGASGGMGRVICRMLAEAGGKLALTSNDRAAMDELKKELPPDTLTEILDITKEEEKYLDKEIPMHLSDIIYDIKAKKEFIKKEPGDSRGLIMVILEFIF